MICSHCIFCFSSIYVPLITLLVFPTPLTHLYILADEDIPISIIIACVVILILMCTLIMIILVIWFKLKNKTVSTTWPNTTDSTPSQRFQIPEMSSPTAAVSPPLPTSMARTHTSLIRLEIST